MSSTRPITMAWECRSTISSTSQSIAARARTTGGTPDSPLFHRAPLLVGALAAIDCEVEDIVERHSHAIVIGRVNDMQVSPRSAALPYWQGQLIAISQNEDALKLAEVSPP